MLSCLKVSLPLLSKSLLMFKYCFIIVISPETYRCLGKSMIPRLINLKLGDSLMELVKVMTMHVLFNGVLSIFHILITLKLNPIL